MLGRLFRFGRAKGPAAAKTVANEAATRQPPVARLRFVAAEPGTASATFAARDPAARLAPSDADQAYQGSYHGPSYHGPERRARDAGPPPGQSDRRVRKPTIVGPAPAQQLVPAPQVPPVEQVPPAREPYTGPDRRAGNAGPPPGQPDRRKRILVRVTAPGSDRQRHDGPDRRARNAGPPVGQSERRSLDTRSPDLAKPAAAETPAPVRPLASETVPELKPELQPARRPEPERASPFSSSAFDAPPASIGQMPPEPERRGRSRRRPVVQPEVHTAPSGFGRRSRN